MEYHVVLHLALYLELTECQVTHLLEFGLGGLNECLPAEWSATSHEWQEHWAVLQEWYS